MAKNDSDGDSENWLEEKNPDYYCKNALVVGDNFGTVVVEVDDDEGDLYFAAFAQKDD